MNKIDRHADHLESNKTGENVFLNTFMDYYYSKLVQFVVHEKYFATVSYEISV